MIAIDVMRNMDTPGIGINAPEKYNGEIIVIKTGAI
jgi:hypothetical protein